MSDITINTFKLGYAPQVGLKNYLLSQGFNEEIMVKAGLLRFDRNNNLQEMINIMLLIVVT